MDNMAVFLRDWLANKDDDLGGSVRQWSSKNSSGTGMVNIGKLWRFLGTWSGRDSR
jgi:hypothetical protein